MTLLLTLMIFALSACAPNKGGGSSKLQLPEPPAFFDQEGYEKFKGYWESKNAKRPAGFTLLSHKLIFDRLETLAEKASCQVREVARFTVKPGAHLAAFSLEYEIYHRSLVPSRLNDPGCDESIALSVDGQKHLVAVDATDLLMTGSLDFGDEKYSQVPREILDKTFDPARECVDLSGIYASAASIEAQQEYKIVQKSCAALVLKERKWNSRGDLGDWLHHPPLHHPGGHAVEVTRGEEFSLLGALYRATYVYGVFHDLKRQVVSQMGLTEAGDLLVGTHEIDEFGERSAAKKVIHFRQLAIKR